MDIEQELAENQLLIDQVKAVFDAAIDLGLSGAEPKSTMPMLKRELDRLAAVRWRLLAKKARIEPGATDPEAQG